jgi:hypothetical protein
MGKVGRTAFGQIFRRAALECSSQSNNVRLVNRLESWINSRVRFRMELLRPGVKRCRQMFSHFCQPNLSSAIVLSGFALFFALITSVSGQDVNARFPNPNKVTADYPDEVERYAAFSTLYDALMADAPKPVSSAIYQKSSLYMETYNGIENQHLMAGRQSPAYQTWATQRDKMINDFSFRRSVLEKYQLTSLSPIARPPPSAVNASPAYQPSSGQTPQTTFAQPNGNPQNYDQSSPGERLNRLCVRAFPVVVISLVGMIWLPWLMLGRAGIKSRFAKPPTLEQHGNLPTLPESLRVIQLPGVRYYVKTFSGLVLGKDTAIYTSSYTETTSERVETIGNIEHRTPGQTTTTRTSRRVDTLRVRTPDLREATWTLTGSIGDRIFVGQVITCIARPVKADFSEFVLVYNNNTGEFVPVVEGLDNAHRPGGILGWLAQPLSTLIGSVGFAILVAYFLTSGIGNLINVGGVDFFIGLWVAGGFCALTVAFFTMHLLKYKITQRRNARLLSEYGPQFRQYFDQITPGLKHCLGVR